MPVILVSTGLQKFKLNGNYQWNEEPATKTEIINIENSNVTCQDLEDFPLQTLGAVGSNIGSSPVICGGNNKNACYRLESGKWHHFAYLLQGYVCIISGLLKSF